MSTFSQVLEVEVAWVAEGEKPVLDFLESKGFVFIKEIWPDYFFVHSSVRSGGD
jgi:hypothetical protein